MYIYKLLKITLRQPQTPSTSCFALFLTILTRLLKLPLKRKNTHEKQQQHYTNSEKHQIDVFSV